MSDVTQRLEELTLGTRLRLEELIPRESLVDLTVSYHELFGVPLKVFDGSGKLLAEAGPAPSLYVWLASLRGARAALEYVVDHVKQLDPGAGDVSYPCVTGASYRVSAIQYEGRRLGRVIFGPYLGAVPAEVPPELLLAEPDLDPARALALLAEMPRAREETITQVVAHLRRGLEIILFSGHKALLTSNMHLASVKESFKELQAKNQSLQEAFDRLKELDRLKSNFLATVSHELRTPLTSIIGYSEMLHEGLAGELTGEQRDFVGTIKEKGEQLLELIKGLLDLSKLESGTMSLRKSELSIAETLNEVGSTLAPAARKKNVALSVQVSAGLPRLWGDAERLRQVFLNLTENALKFTPVGGSVTLSATATELAATATEDEEDDDGAVFFAAKRPALQVRVTDTGIGIPEAERSKVFDAFYQVDGSSTREAGGTGLGLSIVKRLVDGHDGTISIESNEPQGTVFVITLPLQRAGQR